MATGRRGFTLIELLVVIAIIAILAAILFPVFARAKAKALETQCLSNIKNIATAVLIYTSDYENHLPLNWSGPGGSGDPYPGDDNVDDIWRLMQPYLKTMDIAQCPTAPDSIDMTAIGPGFSKASYAFNGPQVVYGDWAMTDGFFPYWVPSWNTRSHAFSWPIQGFDIGWFGETGIMQAAQTAMVWDAKLDFSAAGAPESMTTLLDLRGNYSVKWSKVGSYGIGSGSRLCTNCPNTQGCWDSAGNSPGLVGLAPDPRHNNRLNVAFFDGHAKCLSTAQIEQSPMTICPWDFP